MSLKPKVPKVVQSWPTAVISSPVDDVIDLYNRGFAGTIYNEAEREALLSELIEPDGEKICESYGLVQAGAGKLSMLWLPAQNKWNVWPKPGQTTGNCVGKAGSNIGILLIGIDVVSNTPDEKTGKLEGWPELSEIAIKNGVVADEPIYGDRGHAGQGASCDRLIRHVTEWGGIILRKNYPEINLDLEKTDTPLSIQWGKSQTPENVRKLGRDHQIRNATNVPNHETARDLLWDGNPLWVCSGLGFSDKRDENGFAKQSGSWGHSWVVDGYDDRPDIIKRYGFPLAHFNHDWGPWNSGGRRVLGTDVDIPLGSFWFDARLLDRCDVTAMSSIDGWGRRKIDWSLELL